MTKRDIIDEILDANPTSDAGFLAQFDEADLMDYLHRLHDRLVPTLIGSSERYSHHFRHTDGMLVEDELSVHEHGTPTVDAPMPAVATVLSHGVQVKHDLAMEMSKRYFEPDCPEGDDPCAETMEFEPITIEEPCIDVLPPEFVTADAEMELTALAGQYRSKPINAEERPLILASTEEPAAFEDDDHEAWLF